jgi:hypothetical protein
MLMPAGATSFAACSNIVLKEPFRRLPESASTLIGVSAMILFSLR